MMIYDTYMSHRLHFKRGWNVCFKRNVWIKVRERLIQVRSDCLHI